MSVTDFINWMFAHGWNGADYRRVYMASKYMDYTAKAPMWERAER